MLLITTKTKSKRLRTPLILLCCGLLAACTSINMMAPYDTKTDQRVEAFSKSINRLLYQLADLDKKEPKCRYAQHTEAYRDLKVQLQVMDMHEQAKPDNTQTQKQVKKLQERLDSQITQHKRGCQPAVVINIVQRQVNAMLGHILKLERSKHKPKTNNLLLMGQKP